MQAVQQLANFMAQDDTTASSEVGCFAPCWQAIRQSGLLMAVPCTTLKHGPGCALAVSPSHFISPINLPACLPSRQPIQAARRPRDGRVTYRIDYVVEGKERKDRRDGTGQAGQRNAPPPPPPSRSLSSMSPPPLPSPPIDSVSYCPSTLHRIPKDKKARPPPPPPDLCCVRTGDVGYCAAPLSVTVLVLFHLGHSELGSWAEAKI